MPTHRAASALSREWLESPQLTVLVRRAAYQQALPPDAFLDLLQEVRIALWQRGLDNATTANWVFQVSVFKTIDLLRRRAAERRRDRCLSRTVESTECAELEHLLHVAVEHLPVRLREFYELHYRLGLSEREIAKKLGLQRSSVRWLDRCCRRQFSILDTRLTTRR